MKAAKRQPDHDLFARLQGFGQRLKLLAQDQIHRRREIENRWIEDFRQFNGVYDPETEERLRNDEQSGGGSRIFVNLTRSKTNAAEARLSDMLLPTDDRNWAVDPTPVPELANAANDQTPATVEDGSPVVDEQGNQVSIGMLAKRDMDRAKKAAGGMQKEIDDQLTEARYHIILRDVIHDACLYGAGVVKGPVIVNRARKAWQQEGNVYTLNVAKEHRPGLERVDPWNFYPDISASCMEECEFVFERKFLTKKKLREYARRPGVLKDQVRKVLEEEEPGAYTLTEYHHAELRAVAGISNIPDRTRYELWEYHGPLEREELDVIADMLRLQDTDPAEMGLDMDDEADPLIGYYGCVVFIGNVPIKVYLNPLDSGDLPYSVFQFESDTVTLFGYGVPFLMRSPQKVINAAWRMLLDNGGLSVGPQVVLNSSLIEPADGSWILRPRKVWQTTESAVNTDIRQAMQFFNVPSNQQELAAIFETARNLVDEETNLPMLAQGEKGHAPDTATGMSMMMNAANTVLRRLVKQFDDGITTPTITRFFDYNMQYSDKEEIKGDMEIHARGSSALLVKELQSQSLLMMMQLAVSSPLLAPLTKMPAAWRKLWEVHHLSGDDFVPTDEEIEQAQSQQQGQQDPAAAAEQARMQMDQAKMQIEQAKLEAEYRDRDEDRRMKMQLAMIEREIAMVKLAAEQNLSLEQIKSKLADTTLKETNKANIFTAEKQAEAAGIGGGGGGYL